MSTDIENPAVRRFMGSRTAGSPAHFIPVIALGMGLSPLLAFSYILCVLGYVFVPSVPIAHSALALFLPGFTLSSWTSFCLGLIESLAWVGTWRWYSPQFTIFSPLAEPASGHLRTASLGTK